MLTGDRTSRWIQGVALAVIGALFLAVLVGMVWVIP